MLVYEDKLDLAERLLNELFAIEPHNEEIYIQKANIYSKRDDHEKAVELLKTALEYITKRERQFDRYTPNEKQKKIINRLRSRGYDWVTISKVLKKT